MYVYSHNTKMSWRSFQQDLQRESKQNSRANTKQNFSSSKNIVSNQKSVSTKNTVSSQKSVSTKNTVSSQKSMNTKNTVANQKSMNTKNTVSNQKSMTMKNIVPSQKSMSMKKSGTSKKGLSIKKTPLSNKIVTSLAIIIAVAFFIQQIAPVCIKGTQYLFTEASAFFKHDASSLFKQFTSTKTKSLNNSTNGQQSGKNSNYLSKQDLKAILQQNNLLNLTDNKLTMQINNNPNNTNNTDSNNTNNGDNNTNNLANTDDDNTKKINPTNSTLNNANTPINRKTADKHNITIKTTLDMRLQTFLLEQIESLYLLNRGRPEIIAMVVMEPHTGRILAMTGFDSHSPETNPCTQGVYPAASLFKMVTASAAVETCGYGPATTMYFSGGKYTLYKRQLLDEVNNKFLNKVTLAEAFAQSINPVFGKLGSLILGKDILEKYASSFGFNQEIDSEINFRPGTFTITDDNSYQWAEVACGFNNTTTISPMFGAMLASTMLNSGKTPVPCIVESVKNEKGKILYKRKNEILNDTVKPDTAKAMMQMMNGTIITGTARKSFRGVDKDDVLSRLNMGGKTGSLSSYDNSVKFDWFTGFCSDAQEKHQIVVSVLVGHGKYIGTKASIYGRLIFKEYFNNYFALSRNSVDN